MRGRSSDVRQHDTHKELVGQLSPRSAQFSAGHLDAIVVPASRLAVNLESAITLARAIGCYLVVLCSRDANASDVEQLMADRCFTSGVVVDLPDGYSHPLLEFATTNSGQGDLPAPHTSYATDLSAKRNIGLILARLLGWQRIFYLDDDIRDINAPNLIRTASMLSFYHSAGMQVVEYPDNSVVCHAHRETGKFQDVFVSGSALAVDCTAVTSFFPDIYNEDWLFFYNDAILGKLGSSGLNATQLRYYPFADPHRAAWQEFGDVLAEGLYGLLHQGSVARDANSEYWAYFLKERQRFLQAIIDRSGQARTGIRDSMVAAVQAALEVSRQIQPGVCESYIDLWQRDLADWKKRFTDIPSGLPLGPALAELELSSSSDRDVTGGRHQVQSGWFKRTPPGPVLIQQVPTLDDWWRETSPATARRDPVAVRPDDTLPILESFYPEAGIQQAGPSRGDTPEPWRGRNFRLPIVLPRRRSSRPMSPAGLVKDVESAEFDLGRAAAVTVARR